MNKIKIPLISLLVLGLGLGIAPAAAQIEYGDVKVGPKGVRYVIRGSHGAPHILPRSQVTVDTSVNQRTSITSERPQMGVPSLENRALPQLEAGDSTMMARISSGQNLFAHSPRFTRVASSARGTRIPDATYHFTVNVPENAGQSLKAIKIEPVPNQETISFRTNRIRAFRGDSFAGGPTLSLASIGGPAPEGEELIVFEPPISPGNTVTVALRGPTPNLSGSYLYGVTAFPTGDGEGQFLGYRRLDFFTD